MSVATALLWGMLPVAMLLLLGHLDAVTLTWARFLFAACGVAILLARRQQWPPLRSLGAKGAMLLLAAMLALLGNFVLYLLGLDLLNPEATAVLIQLAPILLLLGSVQLNGEHLTAREWGGVAVLVAGLLIFFNQRLGSLLASFGTDALGVLVMIAAAVSWAIYGLLQKRLLQTLSSQQVTFMIYAVGALTLFPFSGPAAILRLNAVQAGALLFGCINMLLGYGAFTEALRVWQAAKVSAVIALAPVFTIATMQIAVWGWPQLFVSSELNLPVYAGAMLVVIGSMLAALGKAKPA